MLRIVTFATALAFGGAAAAHDYEAGDLKIGHPVIYKSFDMARAAGGYMTIENTGQEPDMLIGVQTESYMSMIHESREQDGIARMIHLDAVEVPAGETVMFKPGGLHIMVMGLQPGDLPVGEELGATLIFDRAGEVPVTFIVEELPKGEMDHGNMDHSGHNMTN